MRQFDLHNVSPYTDANMSLYWNSPMRYGCRFKCVIFKCILAINTLRPRQNGCHFPDDIFKCIFFNENVWISLKISLKYVPNIRINNIPALVQIMAWRWPGDKPLSEPMMFCLLTHICVTQPEWVKISSIYCKNPLKWMLSNLTDDG